MLLPGMDGTGELFAPLLAALGADVPVVVVRYPDQPLDYSAHEEIARSALPIDQPYVLLGESFSGPIAISIAARSPPGLLGYVLCSSFAKCPRQILRALRPIVGLFPPQAAPEVLTTYFLMGRFATAELRALHREVLRQVSPSGLVARLKAIATVDVSDALSRIRLPGLYLRATEDRLVPSSAARLFEQLTRGRVVDVEAPHFLLQANPQVASRVIRDFMREVA